MMLFDDVATFQGVVGLCHHLQWAPLDVKLEVARRVMTFMFSRPDVPANVAKQVGWQDCLTKLLVKKTLKGPYMIHVQKIFRIADPLPSMSAFGPDLQ